MSDKGSSLTRDEKLENIIMNHSMIFMGMFEEAFSAIAEKMTEVMAAGNCSDGRSPRRGTVGRKRSVREAHR